MNFKRHRPKHQRAGCLFCKPWKDERWARTERDKFSVRRQLVDPLDASAIIEAEIELDERWPEIDP